MRGIACLLLLLVTACGAAGQGSSSAESIREVSPSAEASVGGPSVQALGSVDGAPMGYLEFLPPGYGDGEPRPLLVFLHGSGEAGTAPRRSSRWWTTWAFRS